MASLQCECGKVLRNNTFPNTLEGDLKGSYEITSRGVWECEYCGRLAIDVKDDKGLTIVKWYKPEDGEVGNLFGISDSTDYILDLIHNMKDCLNKIEEIEKETNERTNKLVNR